MEPVESLFAMLQITHRKFVRRVTRRLPLVISVQEGCSSCCYVLKTEAVEDVFFVFLSFHRQRYTVELLN